MSTTRRRKRISAAKVWLTVHLVGPLFPLGIKVLVRFMSFPHLSLDILDASDLALATGFIWLFVRQSLIETEIALKNYDKINEKNLWAHICIGIAVLFFVISGLVEVFTTFVVDRREVDKLTSLNATKAAVFLGFTISLPYIVRIQQSFKLKAKVG